MVVNRMIMYMDLVRMEFMNNLAYRASYFTGIFNYAIQIGAYFFLWDAIFTGQKSIAGFTKEQMLTYVIVAWIVRSFYFSNLDRKIADEIRAGNIALELIRPYNYQLVKLARSLGEALFRVFFFTLPSGLFIYLIRPFQLPDAYTLFLFSLAIIGSFVLNVQLSLITGFLAFFTQSTSGIYRAKRVVLDLFSGLLLPITFYPGWAQTIIKALPFQSISYLPNLIYLGKLKGLDAFKVLIGQAFWAFGLLIMATLFWRYAVKKVVIQGG